MTHLIESFQFGVPPLLGSGPDPLARAYLQLSDGSQATSSRAPPPPPPSLPAAEATSSRAPPPPPPALPAAESSLAADDPSTSPAAKSILRPHDLRGRFSVVPTWCDMCSGALYGRGFTCRHCGLRCHAGLGKGTENCRADALVKPCKVQAVHRPGHYFFGDVALQACRDIQQLLKEFINKTAIKEQRSFGKFDRLKHCVHELRCAWDEAKFLFYIALFQLCSVLLVAIVSLLPLLLAERGPCVASLSRLQALWSAVLVLLGETLVLMLVRSFLLVALRQSKLIHRFMHDIIQVNLEELEINLDMGAMVALRAMERALMLSAGLFFVALSIYVGTVRAI